MASSNSPCARASTSRRRIFSAPATASEATRSRSCPLARFADFLVRLARGQLERLASLLRRGKAVGDGLLTRVDLVLQQGPDELHGDPDEERENHCLREKRRIDAHSALSKTLLTERRGEWVGEGEEH